MQPSADLDTITAAALGISPALVAIASRSPAGAVDEVTSPRSAGAVPEADGNLGWA